MKRAEKCASPPARRRAFTLLEIVITIALIAIVAGITLTNMGNLVPAFEKRSAEKSVERACLFATHIAGTQKKKCYVRNVPEEQKIIVENARGEVLQSFEIAAGTQKARFFADARDGTIFFAPAQFLEISRIEFHPAGCATPAFVEIRQDGREPKIFQLDPFSGGLEARTSP